MPSPTVKSLAMPVLVIGLVSWVAVSQYVQVAKLDALAHKLDRLPSRPATTSRPLPIPFEPIALSKTATKGSSAAKVAIVEYADFQCLFCGTFAKTVLPEIQRRYIDTGQGLMSFKHLPLERIHPDAPRAAIAAECAGMQGRFWQMHNLLFADPQHLDRAALAMKANSIGLDDLTFRRCVDGGIPADVPAHAEEARRLLISGTPTFLLGRLEKDGRVKVTARLEGAQSFERFESLLTRLLSPTR